MEGVRVSLQQKTFSKYAYVNLTPKRIPGDNPVSMKLAILGTDSDILQLAEAARSERHEIVWLGDVRPEDAAQADQRAGDERQRVQLHRCRRPQHVQHPLARLRHRQPGADSAIRPANRRGGALSNVSGIRSVLPRRQAAASTADAGVSLPHHSRRRAPQRSMGWIGLERALGERRGVAGAFSRLQRHLVEGISLGVITPGSADVLDKWLALREFAGRQ